MLEIAEEELNTLRDKANKYDYLQPRYNELNSQHETLKSKHAELSESYISLCKGQEEKTAGNKDEFDDLCNKLFKRGK